MQEVYCNVIRLYYSSPLFRKVDIFLLRHYIANSPYRICKEYLRKKGEKDVYTYGETPLTTLEKIANEAEICSHDIFFELGSGRGRSCFWIHCFRKCPVIGIEYVPEFVTIARNVAEHFELKNVSFIYGDILQADFTEASVIYFYGTCSQGAFIQKLIEKLKKCSPGTKIITVSYPLSLYTEKPLFKLIKTFPAEFTWGRADVYIQTL